MVYTYCFFLFSFFFYIAILITFASLFQQTGELCFPNKNLVVTSFLDCFYFSCITFHTIGYGDIIPDGEYSKMLVITLSFLSLLFVVLFSGYSIHLFIKAENEKKKLNVKYIALQNLLQITTNLTKKFVSSMFKENSISTIYFDKYSTNLWVIKEGTHLSTISNAIQKEIKGYVEYLKYSTEDSLHQIGSKKLKEYFLLIDKYLEVVKEHNQKYGLFTDDNISDKIYTIIQNIDNFHYYHSLRDSIPSYSDFDKNVSTAFNISEIIEKAIDLEVELISMSKSPTT